MFTIPFALSGVILALWITGVSLDMIGALGIVLLAGIVVKNGIVLVDYINLMRERGHDLNEAIQISGQSRMRPVLMTAFTTILGMVPMAVSQGEGAEMCLWYMARCQRKVNATNSRKSARTSSSWILM